MTLESGEFSNLGRFIVIHMLLPILCVIKRYSYAIFQIWNMSGQGRSGWGIITRSFRQWTSHKWPFKVSNQYMASMTGWNITYVVNTLYTCSQLLTDYLVDPRQRVYTDSETAKIAHVKRKRQQFSKRKWMSLQQSNVWNPMTCICAHIPN